jgi:predicted HTH transcriptional regulator
MYHRTRPNNDEEIIMAWKGTRPPAVTARDESVFALLKEQGAKTRNQIADALNIPRSLTYLSLDRLRTAGRAKRCFSEENSYTLWSVEVEEPCP